MIILALNPGSSTLKFGLYRGAEDGVPPVSWVQGKIDRLGTAEASLRMEGKGVSLRQEQVGAETPAQAAETALNAVQSLLKEAAAPGLTAIGCRVVHGGERFQEPIRVTSEVIESLRALSPLAPLHNPLSVGILDVCLLERSSVPSVAVFDTAFHRTLPEVARVYGLPRALSEQHGLWRYGFHGLAHRCVSERLLEQLGKVGAESRCITCHLGNGASLCAVRDGRSIDTSMGMTPMEGLVMGTRSGDVDPGLLLYLLQHVGLSAKELDDLLNHRSGLLGLSGRSGDVRDLEQAAAGGDALAEMALEVFAYRAAKTIGAYAVALEGLDAVAFSGGIGEHSPTVRQRICRRLTFLGLTLDAVRNNTARGDAFARINAETSPVQVWVIPADENRQIAAEVCSVLRTSP